MMADYLTAQVEAGVQALQVFDSWAGALGRADYREFAAPHSSRIFSELRKTSVPVVHFGVGTTAILPDMTAAGGDVIGLDWRLPLDDAWTIVGADRAVQGNLDPTSLLGPTDRLFAAADQVLERAAGRPGHIFNVGHGLVPSIDPGVVGRLVDYVHEATAGAAR